MNTERLTTNMPKPKTILSQSEIGDAILMYLTKNPDRIPKGAKNLHIRFIFNDNDDEMRAEIQEETK